jgi:protein-S-isoprenylcysteine O-methyltransferase Ste14
MDRIVLTTIRAAIFVLTVVLWRWVLRQTFPPWADLLCITGTLLAIFPTVWIGRRLLDREPTPGRVAWVTTIMHAVLMTLFGAAIIRAITTAGRWQGAVIPIPHSLGLVLVYSTGAVTLLTVVNLAWRGLGAPFDIALSRRLATDWMYTYTRNPMVLATLACLLAIGLLLQSALFVVWVLGLVAPTWIVYLKVYEERELEIRFGPSYRDYKARTSFLWPRRPKGQASPTFTDSPTAR